jgi:hypothetical protein
MSTKLVKMDATQYAMGYIKASLNMGGSLSKYILDEVQLHQGKITTFLPENAKIDHNTDFRHSIATILYNLGLETTSVPTLASSIWQTTVEDLQQLLKQPNAIFLLEDMLTRIEEIQEVDSEIEYVDLEETPVYFVTHLTAENNSIRRTLEQPGGLPAMVGLVGLVKDLSFFQSKREVATIELSSVLETIRQIIFIAYDAEGFLVWERS